MSRAGSQPAVGRGWVRRLLPYLRGQRGNLALAFGAAGLGSALSASVPLLQRHIVDDAVLARNAPLLPWLGALVLLAVAVFAAKRICLYRQAMVIAEIQYRIRNALHDQLQALDASARQALPTGQLVSRVNSDAGLLVRVLATLPQVAGSLLFTVTALIMMVTVAPLLALCTALTIPAMIYVSQRTGRALTPATLQAQQREGELTQAVDQAVTGVRVVKAFGQEQRELERVGAQAERLFTSRLRAVRLLARGQSLFASIPVFGQVGVLAVGGWLALHHQLTIGAFLAFTSYLMMLVAPAKMLAGLVTQIQRARAAAARIFEVLDSVPTVADRPDARPLPRVRGELDFHDVHFGYDEDAPVLDGFSLRLAPGETVALVGASGTGKSTVALLPARFYGVRGGSVRLDGVDVASVTLASLREQVGMVFEDTFLFSGTVRDNIAYGRPEATDAEVAVAVRAAGLHDFIAALPDGYATMVGERGVGLSGGQRQRVALARALLTDPPVLVLDDVTSAVDPKLEQEMLGTLRQAVAGRTTLLIASRRGPLMLADRIVLLDRGRVADEGRHDELLARSELYRSLLARADTRPADDPAPVPDPGPVPDPAPPARRAVLPERVREPGPRRTIAAAPARHRPVSHRSARSFSLISFLRPYRSGLLLSLILVGLDAMTGVAGPYLSKDGIDRGVVAGSGTAVAGAAALFGLVALVDFVVSRALLVVSGRVGQRLIVALRLRVWAHLLRLPVDFYERQPGGYILTTMATDVESLSDVLSTGLAGMVVSAVTFVAVLVVMTMLNPVLTAVSATVLIPLVVVTVIFARLSAKPYRQARQQIAEVNANLTESMSGARESQAFGQQGRQQGKFQAASRGYVEARMAAQRLISIYFPFVDLLADVAIALVLGVGALLVTHASLTPGELVAFVLYLSMLFAPIQQASTFFDSWQQARVSMERIRLLLAERPAPVAPPHPVEPLPASAELRLVDVRYRYPGATRNVLRGMDLTVWPGETLAVVGASGAGKSTLAKLLVRFHDPDGGQLLLGGVDLREMDPARYRASLGYVPQEPFLFAGSIRDNIAYGRPAATDADVEAVARAVGAHEMIKKLPGGYRHVVTERATSLSAGQRQLLCLARALLVDPAILLLDEATSNLDLSAQSRVLDVMRTGPAGRITIVIAHRLRNARAADRIAVLAAGELVELGTHEELLLTGGYYAGLCAAESDLLPPPPARTIMTL
jgi:ATP-binding cassette subfamily B protein